MEAEISISDIAPGYYPLLDSGDFDLIALVNQFRKTGRKILLLPQRVSDYLVSSAVRDELAFDFENDGLSGDALIKAVKHILDSSQFSGRGQQPVTTLSGGERQILALLTVLKQPVDVIIGRHCFDFVSRANVQRFRESIISESKIFVEVTHHLAGDRWTIAGDRFRPVVNVVQPALQNVNKSDWTLTIKKLNIRYPESSFRLSIKSLHLSGLSILGIMGENGSGKTTLAGCIARQLQFDGQVNLSTGDNPLEAPALLLQQSEAPTHGLDIQGLVDRFVAQERLTVEAGNDVVRYLASSTLYQSIADLDAAVGLRLALTAIMFHGVYDHFILDELTYGLPGVAVAEFMVQLQEQCGAKPLILISHDSKFLDRMCNHSISLEHGSIK